MKTIIKIKTWTCECGYTQDFEPTQENQNKHFNSDKLFRVTNLKANKCPSCALKGVSKNLVKELDINKKQELTIMGEEDIEVEIERKGEAHFRAKKENSIETKIKMLDADGVLVSDKKYRDKHLALLNESIIRLRKEGKFITDAEKPAYREKRKKDITQAIIEARKLEDN